MNSNRLIVGVVLLFCFCWTNSTAQKNLLIKDSQGSPSTLSLTNIEKITFPEDGMMVYLKNGSSTNFLLGNLSLNFTDESLDLKSVEKREANLTISPNPVTDILNLKFYTYHTASVTLNVVDLNGRIIEQQSVNTFSGINTIPLSVNSLAKGIYTCVIFNDNFFEFAKFVKK